MNEILEAENEAFTKNLATKEAMRQAFEMLFFEKYVNYDEIKFSAQDMFEFADWYCNGLSNAERKSPKEMFPEYVKIKQEIG